MFADKIVLITEYEGITSSFARRFAEAGARVIVLTSELESSEAIADELGTSSAALYVDRTNDVDISNVMDAVRQWHGRIDVLVTAANGGYLDAPARAALPLLAHGGSIIVCLFSAIIINDAMVQDCPAMSEIR